MRTSPSLKLELPLLKDSAMASNEFKPWWEKVNDFQNFQELEEFKRGALGYRPGNAADIMVSMITNNWVRTEFEKPESYTGKKKQ